MSKICVQNRLTCWVFFLTVAALAVSSNAQLNWSQSWYDSAWSYSPAEVAAAGCDSVFLYSYDLFNEEHSLNYYFENYMADAAKYNVNVVVGIRSMGETFGGVTYPMMTQSEIVALVTKLEQYSAVAGYYIADEPVFRNMSASHNLGVYGSIRLVSQKPVYSCFCNDDIAINNPYQYRNSYDVMMYDRYLFDIGESEFLEIEGWKTDVIAASNVAKSLNKPFIAVVQAFGQDAAQAMPSKRLPTLKEERFMVYYSLLEADAQNVALWGERWRNQSAAQPGEVYPYDGDQWLADVGSPLMSEMKLYTKAIDAGEIENAASCDNGSISHSVFQDPETGKYWLLSVNCVNSAGDGTFTMNLEGEWRFLKGLDDELIPIINDQFTLSYSQYETMNFELIAVPEPCTGLLLLTGGVYTLFKRNRDTAKFLLEE